MRFNRKYRLVIEDESSLEKRVNISVRLYLWIIIMMGGITLCAAIGIFFLASTPLKNHLPGYLKESERTATEEQHQRLDSLVHVYEVNESYIKSILSALNPSEESSIKPKNSHPNPLSVDSLMSASEEEKQFMERIRERDKYNISYTSPAAAQTLMFGSVGKGAVISSASKDIYKAEILLPDGVPVTTIAEGKVISVASSPKSSGGYEVIIQHPKGFLSKTSRLSNLTVRPGDRVAAGQIIAAGTSKAGIKPHQIIFELWHDGDPLIPSRYLNGGMESSSIK